ncbi:MAG: PTS system mannose/fructose/sorbose family transporter subunit IID [Streptococcaceae bacterium]|nr:PTS system mannose/fructose/sorbose family transporter subunit IID [Streptococcaceae bacterium]
MENKNTNLSKGTRFSVMVRSMFLQGSWNFERMQNLGFLYAILPALKKFYKPGSEEAKTALKRHMEFFNTHPYVAAPIIGVTLALEEEIAKGQEIDEAAIQGVKVGMMGPLAGIGDPVFWFTVRPIVGAIAASLAGTTGSIIAPLFFFFVWNIIRIGFLWYTQEFGYKQGTAITSDLGGGMLQQITKGASILGMFILGVLIQRWVNISFTGPNALLPKQPLQDGAYVGQWISNAHNIGTTDAPIWAASSSSQIVEQTAKGAHFVTTANLADMKIDGSVLTSTLTQYQGLSGTGHEGNIAGMNDFAQKSLQDVFNSLIPGFIALLLTFLVLWILRKWKNRNAPLVIIIAMFVLGILLHIAGLA